MLLPYLNKELIKPVVTKPGVAAAGGCLCCRRYLAQRLQGNELLNDSKQLTEKQRYALREVMRKRRPLAWAVGVVSPEESDKINILNASFLAMTSCAFDRLQLRPQHLLIDGNRFKYRELAAYDRCERRWQNIFPLRLPPFLPKTYPR